MLFAALHLLSRLVYGDKHTFIQWVKHTNSVKGVPDTTFTSRYMSCYKTQTFVAIDHALRTLHTHTPHIPHIVVVAVVARIRSRRRIISAQQERRRCGATLSHLQINREIAKHHLGQQQIQRARSQVRFATMLFAASDA